MGSVVKFPQGQLRTKKEREADNAKRKKIAAKVNKAAKKAAAKKAK